MTGGLQGLRNEPTDGALAVRTADMDTGISRFGMTEGRKQGPRRRQAERVAAGLPGEKPCLGRAECLGQARCSRGSRFIIIRTRRASVSRRS